MRVHKNTPNNRHYYCEYRRGRGPRVGRGERSLFLLFLYLNIVNKWTEFHQQRPFVIMRCIKIFSMLNGSANVHNNTNIQIKLNIQRILTINYDFPCPKYEIKLSMFMLKENHFADEDKNVFLIQYSGIKRSIELWFHRQFIIYCRLSFIRLSEVDQVIFFPRKFTRSPKIYGRPARTDWVQL